MENVTIGGIKEKIEGFKLKIKIFLQLCLCLALCLFTGCRSPEIEVTSGLKIYKLAVEKECDFQRYRSIKSFKQDTGILNELSQNNYVQVKHCWQTLPTGMRAAD